MILTTLIAMTVVAQSPAQWIWATGKEIPANVYFRTTITLDQEPQKAQLDITCDDAYELFVNGEKVASNASWYVMQSVDLKKRLHRGKNVLAVAGRNFDSEAGLLIDGSVDRKSISTGADWRVSTQVQSGWEQPNFDDSTWDKAKVIGPEGIQPWGHPKREADLLRDLKSLRPAKPLSIRPRATASPDVTEGYKWPQKMTGIKGKFVRFPLSPVAIDAPIGSTIKANRTVKADFGREIGGWVEVEIESPNPPVAKISVGEALTRQGDYPTLVERVGKRTIYRLCPTGSFTGLRFAWIDFTHVTAPFKLVRVEAIWRMFPANYEGSFECSDSQLNRIWHIGAYTAHLCLDPTAFGAILRPERGDRFPWMGDDRVTQRTVLNVFGIYDHVKADLDFYVKPGQKDININGIPGYTLDWIIALHTYWMYSGDDSEVRLHLADIKTILDSFDTDNAPPGWLFTDWENGLQSTTDETVLAFRCKYVQAAKLAIDLAEQLGSKELVDVFKRLAEKCTARITGHQDWPNNLQQHSLSNAILAGLSGDFPESVRGYTATPYFTFYVLEALSKAGQDAKALEAIRTVWSGMVQLGATSTWEYYNSKWPQTLKPLQQPPDVHEPGVSEFFVSLCHPWSSGATAWLSEHVLGVTPSSPGFAECQIKPFFGKLAWARGSVPTPKGPVLVSWSQKNKGLSVRVQLPAGVRARLVLPRGTYQVDGKLVKPSSDGAEAVSFVIQGTKLHVVTRD
jgi:hypothetical protein